MAHAYTVSARERSEVSQRYNESFTRMSWEDKPMRVGNFQVVPFGDDNLLPIEIRETIGRHNLAPRIFTKRKFLTWGNGPALYTTTIENGKVINHYVTDTEVESWLKSWNYERYLQQAIEDFNHTEGHFTRVYRNKGARIGRPFINRLEHISVNKCRLGYQAGDKEELPTHVIVGRWHRVSWQMFEHYPLFSAQEPFQHAHSIAYANLYSFATDFYSQPDVVGSLPWIRRSTAIPFVLQALSENSIHIKWHIVSPQEYWDHKREILKEQCSLQGKQYNEQMLEDLKDDIFAQLSEVLSGDTNVGKFWHTEKVTQIIGNTAVEHKWELIPMDQKIKDFVEAQLKIAEAANFQTIAGMGLHQALANIAANGKSDSGSEQLYALRNYILTETQLPVNIITQTINQAIAANWPDKKIKVGFSYQLPDREQDVTPKDRINNGATI